MKKVIAVGLSILFASSALYAQDSGFNPKNIYFGGGLSSNSASGLDNGTGYQAFAGYTLDMIKLDKIVSAVEIGYMDTGKMQECVSTGLPAPFPSKVCGDGAAKGVWANYVASYPISRELSALGRLGLDFGDDDGVMFGVGVDYKVAPQIALRGEYVKRQHVNSLQVNLVYHMK